MSGTDRKAIKIRGSALFVNKIKYGAIIDSVFQRCHSSSDSTLSISSQNTVAASTNEIVAIHIVSVTMLLLLLTQTLTQTADYK